MLLFLPSCSKVDPIVEPAPPPIDTTIHVSSITIDPSEYILVPTLTLQLRATVSPADASNKNINWTISDTSIASINASGIITAKKPGSVTINATSKENNSIKASANLNVLNNYEVHIVGSGPTNYWSNVALYWKDGVASTLPGGYRIGTKAYAITLSGNDVYIAGNVDNQWFWNIPAYWKNGNVHVLGQMNSEFNSFTRSIAVVDNKVYVASWGFYNTECPVYCFGRSRASYFIDDAGVIDHFPLYDDISSTRANGIALKGTDVIIAGAQANDNSYQWASTWKNGVANASALSPSNGHYEANVVVLHGNDLYYSGYGGCPNIGCNAQAYVWINDADHKIVLTDGTKDAQATCIAFSGDVLYVGGYEKNEAGIYVATYWKVNGNTITSYSVSDGVTSAIINGIAVSGDDIFLVGNENNNSGTSKAKCWRAYHGSANVISIDASAYYLPNGYEAYGIAIK